MNSRLRLLAICNYPSETRPAHQVFVRALLVEMAGIGADVTVVAPESLWNLAKGRTGFRLAPAADEVDGLSVQRPRYLTYSNVALPLGGTTSRWSTTSYVKAVLHRVRRLTGSFDLCFGHFLYPQGLAAAKVGSALGIPYVVSLGESSFDRYEGAYSRREISGLLDQANGVVANSTLIKDHCVQRYGLAERKTRVFRNGVDERLFTVRDRKSCRQKCGLPLDRPIIVFAGQFIERKGPLRVLEAIKSRPEIGVVFLGYGPQVPQGPQVLFRGEVPHDEVPTWLSAADAFALPTLNEGCSNAILEALGCGLPIISSDLPFNHGILDEQVAVLVNPRDVGALELAIAALIDSPERRAAMSEAAVRRASSFRLGERAKNVLAFLKELC